MRIVKQPGPDAVTLMSQHSTGFALQIIPISPQSSQRPDTFTTYPGPPPRQTTAGPCRSLTPALWPAAFANLFRSVPDPIAPFVVDRPFAFAVLEVSSTALLFLGRVLDLGAEAGQPAIGL